MLRPDEAFVSCALVAFLGGPPSVSASDGEDPPDLYITFSESRVGVEVTAFRNLRLNQAEHLVIAPRKTPSG